LKVYEILTIVLLAIVASLSVSVSYQFINIESTAVLALFNVLFVSLIFQLKNTLIKKSFLLIVGNLLGVFCNKLFFEFQITGLNLFQKSFETIYVLFFPFLNLIWIVPFWSLSLSFLNETKIPLRKQV
jgi:hypothetical protein